MALLDLFLTMIVLYSHLLRIDDLGLNNTFYWGWRRVAWRAMTISNIFREVWGDCAINDRVRVVLAGQVTIVTKLF